MPRLIVSLCLTVLIVGCAGDTRHSGGPEPCSAPWFQFVEGKVSTGDAEGHGPDPGSYEWRSVVEFKLGIRGDAEVPDRETRQWCTYIDRRLSDQGAVR